jgi:glutamine amidotransferase
VRKLTGDLPLPQMQWNVVETRRRSAMLEPLGPRPWLYFVHSYAPVPEGDAAETVVGTCDYAGEVVAAVEAGSCWATQFHPEKSGANGLALLGAFAKRCVGGGAG